LIFSLRIYFCVASVLMRMIFAILFFECHSGGGRNPGLYFRSVNRTADLDPGLRRDDNKGSVILNLFQDLIVFSLRFRIKSGMTTSGCHPELVEGSEFMTTDPSTSQSAASLGMTMC
jgi:hypothetical protein